MFRWKGPGLVFLLAFSTLWPPSFLDFNFRESQRGARIPQLCISGNLIVEANFWSQLSRWDGFIPQQLWQPSSTVQTLNHFGCHNISGLRFPACCFVSSLHSMASSVQVSILLSLTLGLVHFIPMVQTHVGRLALCAFQ